MKFSANLGFLWADLPLSEAIAHAAAAGFDAVECHWPYDNCDHKKVQLALATADMTMLSLNTRRGDVEAGDFGLSAIPDRNDEARAAIDEALSWARNVNVPNVHVMAGIVEGERARNTFIANLAYAAEQAAMSGITILIEPINHFDVPGYFLTTTDQAIAIIDEVDAPNLKLMFDCYHVQLMEGNLTRRLAELQPYIGHIQFAGVPARNEPDVSEVDYGFIFAAIKDLNYEQAIGAEYIPATTTEAGLAWMKKLA
jgi:hydroxypyruvate isomerase